MKSTIIGLFALLMVSNLQGQTITNVLSSFDGEKITVSYNLQSKITSQRFNVSVFGSHDGYTQPLVVIGDAGENVNPGNGKKLTWDAKRYLPSSFNEDVQIKIKAIPQVELAALTFQPLALKTYKKGRSISLQWSGGNPTDKLTLELYKNASQDRVIANSISNRGSYDWKIPQDVKGKNYSFRLVNSTNPALQNESEKFTVKSRTPVAAIVVPVVVVGAGIAYLMTLGGGESDD
jgi:Ser-Thr-rich glycosyl-phosphatidyl-inositol-anchored membrane family